MFSLINCLEFNLMGEKFGRSLHRVQLLPTCPAIISLEYKAKRGNFLIFICAMNARKEFNLMGNG